MSNFLTSAVLMVEITEFFPAAILMLHADFICHFSRALPNLSHYKRNVKHNLLWILDLQALAARRAPPAGNPPVAVAWPMLYLPLCHFLLPPGSLTFPLTADKNILLLAQSNLPCLLCLENL